MAWTRLAPEPGIYLYAPLIFTTVLTFSSVGVVVASRHPRNSIGCIFCAIGFFDGLGSLAGGYAEYWLASDFGSRSLVGFREQLPRPGALLIANAGTTVEGAAGTVSGPTISLRMLCPPGA